MNEKGKIVIKVTADTAALDEVNNRIEEMTDHLEKAMELANSIASMRLDIRINTVFDDKPTELARVTTE